MKSLLRVCAFAEMIYPERVAQHSQDMHVYRSLRPWAERFYLVVTSAGDNVHVSHDGNVVGIHVPYRRNVLIRRLQFLAVATRIGFRLSKRRQVDLFMAPEPLVGGPIALTLGWLRRVPVLVHIQGDLLALPAGAVGRIRAGVIRRLTVLVAKRAERVRCISKRIFDACLEQGIPEDRLVVLPVRCDFNRFDPEKYSEEERAQIRASLQIERRDFLVVSIGAFTVHKGHSVLMSALALLRQAGQTCRLVLVGEGALRADLERQVADLGLGDTVQMPGWIAHDRIPALLAATDLYVHPSRDEGIPRSILEAMAMQVPVVASRVGGIPELIQHERTGLLVPSDNPAALAAAIARMRADPDFATAAGSAGRGYVREPYDFTAGIARYGRLLTATAQRTPYLA